MTAAKVAGPLRTILIHGRGGVKTRVGGIPANAKITYGPISPGRMDHSNSGNALRIYTTTNNQLAVFTDVVSFRDLTLTVQREQVVVVEKKKHKTDGDNRLTESSDKADVTYTWENE